MELHNNYFNANLLPLALEIPGYYFCIFVIVNLWLSYLLLA